MASSIHCVDGIESFDNLMNDLVIDTKYIDTVNTHCIPNQVDATKCKKSFTFGLRFRNFEDLIIILFGRPKLLAVNDSLMTCSSALFRTTALTMVFLVLVATSLG